MYISGTKYKPTNIACTLKTVNTLYSGIRILFPTFVKE